MAGSVELLFLDDLFFDEAAAGSIGRNGGDCGSLGLRCRLFFFLLLAAEAKEAEAGGRQRVDIVRGFGVGLRLLRSSVF